MYFLMFPGFKDHRTAPYPAKPEKVPKQLKVAIVQSVINPLNDSFNQQLFFIFIFLI